MNMFNDSDCKRFGIHAISPIRQLSEITSIKIEERGLDPLVKVFPTSKYEVLKAASLSEYDACLADCNS